MSSRDLRRTAQRMIRAALAAADPQKAVLRAVAVEQDTLIAGRTRYRLDRFDRVLVLGAGKASAAMAVALESLLKKRITTGVLSVRDEPLRRPRRIECLLSGHPVPDARGEQAARRIAELARSATARDLVICLISGGASALLPAPAEGITLEDKQAITKLLLASGATIHELNAVRKHLSSVKGGQLARLAAPATVLTLILSDVPGDDLDVIGSGPTVPDRSTFADSVKILRRNRVWDQAPASIRERFSRGERGEISETPKPGDALFRKVQNLIVGSNRLALAAAAVEAKAAGFRPLILSSQIEGETRDVAFVHAAIAREIRERGVPIKAPACVLSGGETTVTIKGNGKGGRNQEFALAAALKLARMPDVLACSFGTDGSDGPTDAAGAIATGETILRSQRSAQADLDSNNSYEFFRELGDLVQTGPTGTNVMDVRFVLVDRAFE
jgi:hydroxypyruvate reductase